MQNGNIFASELGTSRHSFRTYHFCRGNSNKRKTRIGIILKGHGAYIYLGKRLSVSEGDVVFIPENIYCYSEWRGEPDIEVVYLSCFLHYESFKYEPQIIRVDDAAKTDILQISELLSAGQLERLEAYSRFYRLLQTLLPKMAQSDIAFDKTLQTAIEYITENWNTDISVSDLAKKCCVSESTVYHLFRRELGQTPISFLNSIRINVAIEYLENTQYSISTVSREVGFNSENHFRRIFFEHTGTTPLKFRKKG
jgi:AraC-like DNA-binding protein